MRSVFVEAMKSLDVTGKLKAGERTVMGLPSGPSAAVLTADSKQWGKVARRIKLGQDQCPAR
jgi:hypothetical protein